MKFLRNAYQNGEWGAIFRSRGKEIFVARTPCEETMTEHIYGLHIDSMDFTAKTPFVRAGISLFPEFFGRNTSNQIKNSVTNGLGYDYVEGIQGTRQRFFNGENTEIDLQAHLAGMEARTSGIVKSVVMKGEIRKLNDIQNKLGDDSYVFTTPEQVKALIKLEEKPKASFYLDNRHWHLDPLPFDARGYL